MTHGDILIILMLNGFQYLLVTNLKYPIHELFDLMMRKEEDLPMDETERT